MRDNTSKNTLPIEKSKDTKKAIQLLKNLFIDDCSRKYPNVPKPYIPAPKYTDKTANGLTRCIIDYIELVEARPSGSTAPGGLSTAEPPPAMFWAMFAPLDRYTILRQLENVEPLIYQQPYRAEA